jgi:hypothetical protein
MRRGRAKDKAFIILSRSAQYYVYSVRFLIVTRGGALPQQTFFGQYIDLGETHWHNANGYKL